MTLASIRQSIENIDYAWNKPQTYLVLVPVLSLLIQKVQIAALKLFIPRPQTPHDATTQLAKLDKFKKITVWHIAGSCVQFTASIIATNVFATHWFLIISGFAVAEATYTFITFVRNDNIHPQWS